HRSGCTMHAGVVLLDSERPERKHENFIVREGELRTILVGRRHVHHLTMSGLVVDETHLFGAELLPNEGSKALSQCCFVDVELIRDHAPLNDALPEAEAGRDENHLAMPSVGIQGEDDARACEIGAHHLLHTYRQRYLHMVEAHIDAVADGARCKE